MKNLLFSFIALLFAGGVGAQAPGTVKSAVKLDARPNSLGTSNSWGGVGTSITSYPDKDGDGIRELVFMNVGGNGGLRGIHIFGLSANGTLKANPVFINETNTILSNVSTKYPGNSVDYLGTALTTLKDLNGNGVDELVVTDGSTGGKLFVLFLNNTYGIDSFTMIRDGYSGFNPSGNTSGFGKDIANIGDLDKDGVEDLAVGSWYNEGLRGGVYILFMKQNGTVKSHKYIGNNSGGIGSLAVSSYFGEAVEGIGDLNQDGVQDIMVGSHVNANGDRGEIWTLFLNTDGSVKSYKLIQPTTGSVFNPASGNALFGSSIANVGDLDGDSITDLGISAYRYVDSLGGLFGRVYITFMKKDGTAKASQSIDRFYGNLSLPIDTLSRFGYNITAMGDINGDGIFDLAVGAPYSRFSSSATNPEGAIYLLNLNGIPITTGIGDQLHNLTDSYFLYPNPTSDVIRIRSRKPLATALQVRLLDAAGRTVKMASGEGSATLEIEVAHLPAGMYNIELSNGKEVQWGKFIKN